MLPDSKTQPHALLSETQGRIRCPWLSEELQRWLALRTSASMICDTQQPVGCGCRGAYIHSAAQVLGHKDIRMAARYQHLTPGHLGDTVKGIDALVEQGSRHHSVAELPAPESDSLQLIEKKWRPQGDSNARSWVLAPPTSKINGSGALPREDTSRRHPRRC